MNAANEVAVEAFLQNRIAFTRIAGLIEDVLEAAAGESLPGADTLDDILAVDAWARHRATAALPGPVRKTQHA